MSLAAMRDLAIVVLALESIVIGVLLILLLWQLRRLTLLLERQIKPMLDSLQQTVGTVRGTTSLVSETIVSPAIKLSGMAAGIRQTVRVLAGLAPNDKHG